jgi:leucyl aminopeptidase
LTGAARVALGAEIQALFTRRDDLAAGLLAAAVETDDPLWRMPLWAAYRPLIEGRISDLVNMAPGPFGGAINAALFLAEFVPASIPWVHLDIFAGNVRARPGRPEGGEATGLQALYAWLRGRYG